MKKTYQGVTTTYIFSGTKPIAEYVGGSVTKEYIYSGETQLAEVAYSGLNSSITYKYPDHLSTRAETDTSGNLTRTFGHVPFGETWYETGASSKWKFTTYERDSETNNDYATFRYHENRLGRFMTTDPYSESADPVAPQTWNRFGYVDNDPLNFIDPLGLFLHCANGRYIYKQDPVYGRVAIGCAPDDPSGGRVGGGGAAHTAMLPTPDEGGTGGGAANNDDAGISTGALQYQQYEGERMVHALACIPTQAAELGAAEVKDFAEQVSIFDPSPVSPNVEKWALRLQKIGEVVNKLVGCPNP